MTDLEQRHAAIIAAAIAEGDHDVSVRDPCYVVDPDSPEGLLASLDEIEWIQQMLAERIQSLNQRLRKQTPPPAAAA